MEEMTTALTFLLFSFILTFGLYPKFIDFLYKFQLREKIRFEGPSTHRVKHGTPTMAGILFVGVSLLLSLISGYFGDIWILLFAVFLAAILGGADDLLKAYRQSPLRSAIRRKITPYVTLSLFSWNLYRILLLPWDLFKETFRALGSWDEVGLKSHQKFLLQAGAGFFVALPLYAVCQAKIALPFLGSFGLGIFYIPLFVFLFAFFLNSVSITDGLDGLLGGVSALIFTALTAIALLEGAIGVAIFCASVVGALIAFLYFNVFPARVFMGNAGSYALGAAFVVVLFLLRKEYLLFVLGAIFVAEILSVVIQVGSVKMGRGKVFLMAPIHHHFEVLGWPETKITMRFWLAQAIFSFLGVLLALLS